MTEEEKKAAEEAEAEAKAEADTKDEDKKAIEEALKLETEKRIKAENDLEETRQKAREAFEERERKRKKEEEGDDEDEEDKPITKKNFNKILEDREEKIRKEMREEQASDMAKKLAESESESNLIMEIWKNRTLSGTLKEQIEEAHAIATYKRSRKQKEEMERALEGKDGENNDGSNTQRKPAAKGEPNVNATDKTVLAGMTWDGTKNAYKKLIAGGKKTFYVSRDLKKRWVE